MNVKRLLFLVAAASLVSSVTASAQSLVDIANEEKARRAKLRSSGKPARVYTENERTGVPLDVILVETGTTTTTTTTTVAVTPAGGKKEKSPEELAAERQKEWTDRLQKAQEDIRELESTISRKERSLGSMINITPARADLANSIEADKKTLGELRQSLTTLEDERRRAGMPRPRE